MADFYINYNQDVLNGTLEVLEASELSHMVHSGMKVSIKPNLVMAKPSSEGATTHVEVVEAIVRYLKDLGVHTIEVVESAWIGDDTKRAYRVCGYNTLKKYNVPLIDLKDDSTCHIDIEGNRIEVCRKAIETDFLINVPVLKAHCQTRLTCNLKNLKGCIPDREKRRFHTLGLHKPIAYLNKAIHTHFCVVDGICGDLTFEEGGNPVTRNMVLAGEDPLLMDSYCAELLGYHWDEVEYITIASKLQIGRTYNKDTSVLELNQERKPQFTKPDKGLMKQLSSYISEDKACSACYSALIHGLHHVKEFVDGNSGKKIKIGQGFRGKSGILGCGNCASGCDRYVKGCPPKAVDVVEFLKENVDYETAK